MNPHPNRRNFLKFGAAVPLAISSLNARESQKKAEPPKRIIFICNSLGFYKNYFYPKQAGKLGSSEYLKELKLPKKLTLLENLFHPGMETSNHDSEKSFLTGAPNPEALGFVNHESLDQVLAKSIGNKTRFPFLSFSLYDRGWGCSWNDRGASIPPMNDENEIFNLLFGPEDLEKKKKQIADDQLILDSLRRDLQNLVRSNPNSNQLENYRTLIIELDAQLKHDEYWLTTEKPKVKKSLTEDNQFPFSNKIRNLFEMAKLAFRTDSTRVITFTMDWIYGAINVPGATGGWHTLSHHGGRPETLKNLRCVEEDILRHFNQFLVELDQIQEGQGTLLDNTTVVLGSNFGDASNHTCHKLPIIVAGGGFSHQQHKVIPEPMPLCNLWLELLHLSNIDLGKFGSSTGNKRLLES